MNRIHQLYPYILTSHPIDIEASFSLSAKSLTLKFLLHGAFSNYLFPTNKTSTRTNELWRATCFELFLKNPNAKEYWELNIAPSGAWNFYRFSDYKKDMQEESRVLRSKVVFKKERDEVEVNVKIDFTEKLFDENVEFNLALILLDVEERRHFFTLNPKESMPDFHDFILIDKRSI